MKKLLLLLLFASWPVFAMEPNNSHAAKQLSEVEKKFDMQDNLKKFLRTAEKILRLDPQLLVYNDEIEGARTDGQGLIEISTRIKDEDMLKYLICHEVGHNKDNTARKSMLAHAAYYNSSIILPIALAYGVNKWVLSARNFTGSTYASAVMLGIGAAFFFHNPINGIITRHLEKRADLIAIEYLLSIKEYPSISKILTELEKLKAAKVKDDVGHPTSYDMYNYLTDFLKRNNIHVQSEIQQSDNRLNGSLSLIQNKQTLSHIQWQWKPKC